MVVIGLTGGTASGKSTVSQIMKTHGAEIIDADVIARELVAPGTQVLSEIGAAFGQQVINADGSLNRRLLGRIVFGDRTQLQILNSIVHPPLKNRIRDIVKSIQESVSPPRFLVVDAAVLVEAGLVELVDVIVVVVASDRVRIERLRKRDGLSYEEAVARVKAQRSNEEFARYADYVIDTTDGVDSYRGKVADILRLVEAKALRGQAPHPCGA